MTSKPGRKPRTASPCASLNGTQPMSSLQPTPPGASVDSSDLRRQASAGGADTMPSSRASALPESGGF